MRSTLLSCELGWCLEDANQRSGNLPLARLPVRCCTTASLARTNCLQLQAFVASSAILTRSTIYLLGRDAQARIRRRPRVATRCGQSDALAVVLERQAPVAHFTGKRPTESARAVWVAFGTRVTLGEAPSGEKFNNSGSNPTWAKLPVGAITLSPTLPTASPRRFTLPSLLNHNYIIKHRARVLVT